MTHSPASAPSFQAFSLDSRLIANVESLGFETPTPIQAEAIPHVLAGRDISGGARTGSGKTAAFGLPLLQRLLTHPPSHPKAVRAIVLTPTRELALQVTEALRSYAKGIHEVSVVTVYGGASYGPQRKALARGVPIVVGTPGRVKDLASRGILNLASIEVFVLDEADEMLRMGFVDDVTELLEQTPETRQVALFSATMPSQIRRIANRYLRDPAQVQVESSALSVDHIEQHYIEVPGHHKLEALMRLLDGYIQGTTLVFVRTRAGCAEVSASLAEAGMAVDALHGDLAQSARELVLKRLRSNQLTVVIATDVAARGIDVDHITTVVNLDLPTDTETYVHRIGRTGRAGREGLAISLITRSERRRIRTMERTLRVHITQLTVPSDRTIADRRRAALEQQLTESLASNALPVETWLNELAQQQGWTHTQAATAALALLANTRGIPLGHDLPDAPPVWARQRTHGASSQPASRQDRSNLNEVELMIRAGHNQGVGPGDFVGALTNEFGIQGSQIGRIAITRHNTFVGMPRAVAQVILAQAQALSLRGVEAPMRMAQPRPTPPTDSPPTAHTARPRNTKGQPKKRHFKNSGRKGNGPGRGRH